MLGTGVVNINIAYPRYKQIKMLCEKLIGLFELLHNSSIISKNAQFAREHTQLVHFCEQARADCEKLFSIDLSEYEWNLSLVESDTQTKFADVYDQVKKSELVRTFIVMCDRLVPYRKNYEDLNNLNHKFVNKIAGAEWMPFPFVNLNLKHIFSLIQITNSTILLFMSVLSKAYELSKKLYTELRSPDIDIDQFVDILMANIDKIQCIPELHRCREAFNKIKESVKLLKTNFTDYYHDFIETNDSTIIMQHFILDVSKSTEANAVVTAQFRKIISYYRNMAQSQIKNPKAKALFDKVNESIKSWERDTENLVNISKTESEESDCDSAPISTATKTLDELTKEDLKDNPEDNPKDKK
jgi:hypothetical protein